MNQFNEVNTGSEVTSLIKIRFVFLIFELVRPKLFKNEAKIYISCRYADVERGCGV